MKKYMISARMLVLILPLLFLFPECKKKSSNTTPPACYTNRTGMLFFTNANPLSVDTFTVLISLDSAHTNVLDSFRLASGQAMTETFTLGKRYIDAYYYNAATNSVWDSIWSFTIMGCDSDSINLTGYQSQPSDRRLKKDILPLDASLEKILQLPAYSFMYDKTVCPEMSLPDGRFNGFMAQDLECLFPELVQTNKKGYYSVNYTGMIPVLAKALQEQQQQIQALQKEVREMKAGRDKGI